MDSHEIVLIREKLTAFNERCEAIMSVLADKRRLSQGERERAAELYRSLKDDLKRAAAIGTVTGEKRALTDTEECFYAPAVRAAALDLKPAVNSNPITADWLSALYDAQIEFVHFIPKLEGT